VPGDRTLKWAQTPRPSSFHELNVLAYGKYDTLKYGTYLTFTKIRAFEIILELQTSITVFIDCIHDNTSSEQSILTDQLTNKLNPLTRVIFEDGNRSAS
jgi:hypothetical protein